MRCGLIDGTRSAAQKAQRKVLKLADWTGLEHLFYEVRKGVELAIIRQRKKLTLSSLVG